MTATAAPGARAAGTPVAAARRAAAACRLGLGDRWSRLAPTAVAAVLAAAYVLIAPPSLDLAAHLFRAQLFAAHGFVLWDNAWYGGHATPGYSLLFPAVSAALTPQLAAALAGVGTAALLEGLTHRHFGPDAWPGAVLFAAAIAINLYTGRLALAFGGLPAVGAIVLLDRGRAVPAAVLAAVAGLCSPVAALFAALAAGGCALSSQLGRRRPWSAVPAAAVGGVALMAIGVLAVAFPEGGTEPFALSTLLPLLIVGLALLPGTHGRLRAGIAVYLVAGVACYLVPSPVGSNIARLGTFAAAPVAALAWWPRRRGLLVAALLPLLYLGWQAPVRDVAGTAGDPSVSAAYYRPLLAFLHRQPGVFRTEIPFTRSHWEAYWVARSEPLARGWERQLDRADNPLFYARRRLTASAYAAWLRAGAVRFVALADAPLDDSARAEAALIRQGLPYLHLVMRSRHWRVYAVADAARLASGAATATALEADAVDLVAAAPGPVFLRVRYTPYWALAQGSGCVAPAGDDTRLRLTRAGAVRLVIRFAPGRIGARTPRCTPAGAGRRRR